MASKIRQARNVIACRADGYQVFGAGRARGRAPPGDRCGGTKTGSDYGEAQSGTRMRNDLVKNPVTTQPGNFLGSPKYGSIYSSHDRSKGEPIPRLTRTTNTRQTVSLQEMTGEMRPGVLIGCARALYIYVQRRPLANQRTQLVSRPSGGLRLVARCLQKGFFKGNSS